MFKKSISLVVASAAMVCLSSAVQAAFVTVTNTSVGGGAANSQNYANFDSFIPPQVGGPAGVNGGITVDLGTSGQIGYLPNVGGVYAAPFLSGNNGVNFGSQPDGADATSYLTTGSNTPSGDVTLFFSTTYTYLGILWGSVDDYNRLDFFDATNTLIGSVTGLQVNGFANGDQQIGGTFYVNVLTSGYTKVVATSTQAAFEFDNVAYGDKPDFQTEVPEPASIAMWGLGALGLMFARRKRAQSSIVG